ncbi:Transglutaminase-like superfamily protein [compost metagenome]
MLRSLDVPAKLVMGTTEYVTTYHAWNEVYLNGSWVIIDTTVDSGWMGTTTPYEMIKDYSKYTISRQY